MTLTDIPDDLLQHDTCAMVVRDLRAGTAG